MTSVAIVIPTLNRARLLRGAIASALTCDPPPDELVVVDCGSTDDTREVVRSFGDDVELIERTLPNAASARNEGLAATRAPYVGFLDSDDEALRCKTGGLAAALDTSTSAGLVHGTMEVVGSDGQPLPEQASRIASERTKAIKSGTTYSALAGFCSMYTSATLIRRTSLEQIGGFDERLDTYEDWDFYLRVALQASLEYVDCPAATYRVWSGNVAWDRTARGIVEVSEKHLAMLASMTVDDREAAEFGFLRRLATAQYTLVQLREARQAAWTAVRHDPRSAIEDEDIRRVIVRSWLPSSILQRRRGPTSE